MKNKSYSRKKRRKNKKSAPLPQKKGKTDNSLISKFKRYWLLIAVILFFILQFIVSVVFSNLNIQKLHKP